MRQALQSTRKSASRSRDRHAAMSAVTLLVYLALCWPCRRAGEGAVITCSAACPADWHVGAHYSSAG